MGGVKRRGGGWRGAGLDGSINTVVIRALPAKANISETVLTPCGAIHATLHGGKEMKRNDTDKKMSDIFSNNNNNNI